METGDTLKSYLNWYQPLIVEYTDSILIGNDYHKEIFFQYGEATIIEGIGSLTGIVEELVAFEGGSSLCALYVDSLLIYPDVPCNLSITDTCLYSSAAQNFASLKIGLFPNPAHSFCMVNIPEEFLLQKPKLEIYNLLGTNCGTYKLTSTNDKIDIDKLPNGLYVFVIYSSHNLIFTKKLIKE